MLEEDILDQAKVARLALQNTASIAGLLCAQQDCCYLYRLMQDQGSGNLTNTEE
jgi:hypothetical protein